MNCYKILFIAWLLFGTKASAINYNSEVSSVWIFSGHPGSEDQNEVFADKVESIRKTLSQDYHVTNENIHSYVNVGDNSSSPCTKENILKAFININEAVKKGQNCLIIFLGHANSTAKDIHFNLPGSDLSIKELSKAINPVKKQGSLGIIWAVESGERAVKLFRNKNCTLLASAETEDRDNEPVLNEMFDKLLDKNLVDTNKDGMVTFLEMHTLAKKEVKKWYQDKGLIQLEKIILDGDGNGIGTSAPSSADAKRANKTILKY